MFGLTGLGTFHTAISLVAVFAALIALIRYGEITARSAAGKIYVSTTIVVCVTGFGIFQHGGFGVPHVLSIITLIVLGLAGLAGYTKLFARASRYVETVGYSATLFFHFIPALAEVGTRLPVGAPLFDSPEDPNLQVVIGVLFVVFLIGATLQVWRLRAHLASAAAPRGVATPSTAA